jgi:hypothetical protein
VSVGGSDEEEDGEEGKLKRTTHRARTHAPKHTHIHTRTHSLTRTVVHALAATGGGWVGRGRSTTRTHPIELLLKPRIGSAQLCLLQPDLLHACSAPHTTRTQTRTHTTRAWKKLQQSPMHSGRRRKRGREGERQSQRHVEMSGGGQTWTKTRAHDCRRKARGAFRRDLQRTQNTPLQPTAAQCRRC